VRIALFADRFPELSETFISGEVWQLLRTGHEVHVESEAHASQPDPDAGAGVDVAYLDDDSRGARLRALAWLLARHPFRALRDVRGQRRWAREETVRPLRRIAPAVRRVAAARSEHVHAHFAARAALDGMRVARLLGVPYSVATHGYDIFQTPMNLVEKHARSAFAVTPCTYSLEYLKGVLPPKVAERVHRIVVGVDPEQFKRIRPYPGGRTVIAVARLIEKKGIAHLVEAAHAVHDRGGMLDRVVIVGDGPLRGVLEHRVERLSIEGLVEFAGPKTPNETRALLDTADVLVMPSVIASDGDRDTMPVVVKEALAMEIPVIASDEVGLPEVVHYEWGRLVQPGDVPALADAIDEVLGLPPEERRRMGAAGLEFVVAECSLEGGTAKLAQLIATRGRG
jgi:glycosyltransferase involved in cell wall biosynthesis